MDPSCHGQDLETWSRVTNKLLTNKELGVWLKRCDSWSPKGYFLFDLEDIKSNSNPFKQGIEHFPYFFFPSISTQLSRNKEKKKI